MQDTEKSANTKAPVIPTSFFIPKALHSRAKTIAGIKGVTMADIFIEGIRMALESERLRVSDEERQRLFRSDAGAAVKGAFTPLASTTLEGGPRQALNSPSVSKRRALK